MIAGTNYCTVAYEDRGVARVTVCNSGSLNIIGTSAMAAVAAAIAEISCNDSIRVVVVGGESDKAFIGGADIREMAQLEPGSARNFIACLAGLCDAIRSCPVPVVARIPGWCLGGGLEVAAACDIRLAGLDARFAMPEVKVGIPSVIHAALLPRLIGAGRARFLTMTAATIDAPMALAWGLIDALAEADGLDVLVDHTVTSLLDCGHAALKAQKQLCRQWDELPLADSIRNSITIFDEAFATGEPQQRMLAFLERKRKPSST